MTNALLFKGTQYYCGGLLVVWGYDEKLFTAWNVQYAIEGLGELGRCQEDIHLYNIGRMEPRLIGEITIDASEWDCLPDVLDLETSGIQFRCLNELHTTE